LAETLTIPHRFHGPPDSGNGGWSAGAAARFVGDGPVEVTLRMPPPLERPLAVERTDGAVRVLDGDEVVIEARPAADSPAPPPPVDAGEAACSGLDPDEVLPDHIFPSCFTCGPQREEGDGLRLLPGAVDAPGLVATTWVPHESMLGPEGAVAPEVLWAALDCPTYWVHRDREIAAVLGRLTADIQGEAHAGEELVVVARDDGAEGRKLLSSSALYGPDGSLVAAARAVWITIEA